MQKSTARSARRRWMALVVLALLLGGMAALTTHALGLRTVEAGAAPLPQPAEGFDVAWWDSALSRWVRDGRVDYARVLDEREGLRSFAATLSAYGPTSTPERFPTVDDRLAYYVNAYNALTLFGVVENWPLESVQDVHGWLDPRPGFGFFYGLRFSLDGDEINLYDLENGVIRGFRDARIHAAINCASISCPPLQPFAFRGADLEAQLDRVTRAFCSSPMHVRVDREAREIQLSAIFDWYRPDFEEHARRLGAPPTLLGFIAAFVDREQAEALEEAQREGFATAFLPYDWGLNRL